MTAEIPRHISERTSIIDPFASLSYSDDPLLLLTCAKNYTQDIIAMPRRPLWQGAIWRNDRIKLAYISADFRNHPTSYLAAELFELHDRSRFEVIGLSLGSEDGSAVRRRLAAGFDQFIEVETDSDEEVAQLLNQRRIDISIDLMGHTERARPQIFAFRPTPIQVNYLGFPGTTGASFVDYIIADQIVLPFDQQRYYTENIVHLPGCYQVNDRKRTVSTRAMRRCDFGLPQDSFVFCCFNNSWKITPAVFDIWMRLLQSVEHSVFWLLRDNSVAEINLRREASARGVDPGRLVFAEKVPLEEHLARHRLADLFLDTLPYNAHTTASDALWMGLPVLTCQGNAFAGRVASSLLYAIGVPELVAGNLADYEALALKLSKRERGLLRDFKARIIRNRETHPLFDTDHFRRSIEAAYERMWEIWQRGEIPRPFAIAPTVR